MKNKDPVTALDRNEIEGKRIINVGLEPGSNDKERKDNNARFLDPTFIPPSWFHFP